MPYIKLVSPVTYYLFADPCFLSGVARVLDLGGHFDSYNFSRSIEEADQREFAEDWLAVEHDFAQVWKQLAEQNPDYVEALAEAISQDPYLSRMATEAMQAANQTEMNVEEVQTT